MSFNYIIRRCKQYYKNNPCGGSLHIVLDDGNIERENIEFCLKYAKENNDLEGIKLANLLLSISYKLLEKIYKNYDLYC